MLCEALTQLPHSLVFNEPNIAFRRFVIRGNEAELLALQGIDLQQFIKRWSVLQRRFLLYGFRKSLLPRINPHIAQIGIKEIFHANWRAIQKGFPNLRVVLTARDPRDIYLSLHNRYMSGAAIWNGEFTPERVAAKLNEEFTYQLEMSRELDVLKIRYEDLCLDADSFRRVFEFVESDIKSLGQLGALLQSDEKRTAEGQLHAGKVTDRRVARWKSEQSDELVTAASRVMQLMPHFCEFWEYD